MTIKGRGHMDPLEVGVVQQAMPQGIIELGAQTIVQVQQGTDRPQRNDRRKAQMRLGEVIPVTGDMRSREESCGPRGKQPRQFGLQGCTEYRAIAFEPLNRSLETFLTRLIRTNERSEKSRRVFKKPRCYKNESDGCIDIWIEVMKLHFEEEDLSESNLEGTALNCVMAKKHCQRDTAEKIFEILLTRFGSGVQGHQAMMRFEKRR